MPVTDPSTSALGRPASAPRPAGPARSEGQWALGEREPLNQNERLKVEDNPLNVRARIENVYARGGFASIDPGDLHGRFRWHGLYTQRKPGIGGERTATMAPEELDDEFFMLRVRTDGGIVSLAQLRTLATISQRYARDSADVTDRQNIQLHWIRIEDMPAIWQELEAVGLRTTEACGDTPRVVLGSPLAGVAADEIIDGTPAIEAIVERWIGDPELSNLPRKFKTAISGSPHQDVAHEIHDIAFIGVVHPELGPGFDLWIGGGLSTNPMLAQRLGAFVPLDRVPEVWHAVIRLYRDYGYRRLRTRARLKFLIADWGVARFRQILQDEYLGRALDDGPAPPAPAQGNRDHIGVNRQRDGKFYIGLSPVAGRVGGTALAGLADAVERAGSARIRLTAQQKIVVLDVLPERVADFVDHVETLGLTATPSPFRRGTMACTGIEFCKLAVVETKALARNLVATLEDRLSDVPALFEPSIAGSAAPALTVHINGCPNSCARAQIADIGLKGVRLPSADSPGETVDGFQIHLGGGLGLSSGFGRKLRGLKTTASELPGFVERITRLWLEQRKDDETFASWVQRADEGDLR